MATRTCSYHWQSDPTSKWLKHLRFDPQKIDFGFITLQTCMNDILKVYGNNNNKINELLILQVSSSTIQWPCIVIGYTGRLPVVIQQYSATIEHWSCTTVQPYITMWSNSRNENWLTTLGDSVRLQDNQNKNSLVPPRMGLISSPYLTCLITFIVYNLSPH